jgi:hypothetical protein
MSKNKSKSKSSSAVTFDTVRRLALELPGVVEVSSYGTPGFKVKGKLFLRFHQDGESLVVAADFADRDAMILEQPERFYITDHYLNYPWVLVRLATIRDEQLPDLLKQAWRFRAPRQKPGR